MSRLYVFDLDGTLADLTHRLHYITHPLDQRLVHPPDAIEKHKGWKKDWDAFSAACHLDLPIAWVVRLYKIIANECDYQGDRIIILSARTETQREATEEWLEKHGLGFYGALLMRPVGDFRPDSILKPELLNAYLFANPFLEVEFIVEDRQSVVDVWRAAGYRVLQCDAWKEER